VQQVHASKYELRRPEWDCARSAPSPVLCFEAPHAAWWSPFLCARMMLPRLLPLLAYKAAPRPCSLQTDTFTNPIFKDSLRRLFTPAGEEGYLGLSSNATFEVHCRQGGAGAGQGRCGRGRGQGRLQFAWKWGLESAASCRRGCPASVAFAWGRQACALTFLLSFYARSKDIKVAGCQTLLLIVSDPIAHYCTAFVSPVLAPAARTSRWRVCWAPPRRWRRSHRWCRSRCSPALYCTFYFHARRDRPVWQQVSLSRWFGAGAALSVLAHVHISRWPPLCGIFPLLLSYRQDPVSCRLAGGGRGRHHHVEAVH